MQPDREPPAFAPLLPRDPRAAFLWPVLLGTLVFFALGGAAILVPGHVAWLSHGDLAQSYLGWAFYRDSPWQWPPGANPAYGLEIASSVYYSDSIPLLAVCFKLLAPLLPAPFQYFGLWVLMCLVLQAWFAWKLAGLASRDLVFRSVVVLLLVTAPPMLNRLSGHLALVGHWPLLAGLYLCLRPDRRRQAAWWALLVACAMAIHAYLFVLVGVLWVTDLIRRYREDAALPARKAMLLKEGGLVVGAALLSGWLSGLFTVSGRGMRATGFGHYKMNLLAPFDGAGWSALGLHARTAAGEYEGFNYLGAGAIVLVALALVLTLGKGVRAQWKPRHTGLALMAVVLTALAMTHVIGLGGAQWSLPLPARLVDKLQALPVQATGRLFWAVYYLVVVAALFAVARALPRVWLRVVLVALLVLQVVDLYPGWSQVRANNRARAAMTLPGDLRSAFWDEAGGKYQNLRRIPTTFAGPGWEAAAFYAQRHGMATEIVQVARLDVKPFWALDQRKRAQLFAGAPEPDSLYLVNDSMVDTVRAALVRPRDALFRLQGRIVLAPDWGAALPPGATNLRSADAGPYRLPFRADLSQGSQARALLGADGERIDAEQIQIPMTGASVYLPTGGHAAAALQAQFELQDLTKVPTGATLRVLMDGQPMAQVSPDGQGRYSVSLRVPPGLGRAHFHKLDLQFESPSASKKQMRKWKVGLTALEVSLAGG